MDAERIMRGKLRRAALAGAGEKPRADRRGRCTFCGDCCRLLLDCPSLMRDGSRWICMTYQHRSEQCRGFPYTPDDLADLVAQHGKNRCGYYFAGGR